MTDGSSLTHAAPRITELTFADALIEGPHAFPGWDEIGSIWRTLITAGVDPSFALGQFWVESLFGTAGWNIWSEPRLKSWGNILYPNSLVRDVPGVGEYAASNGYHYTYYPNWTTGVLDYVRQLELYAKRGVVPVYGDLRTIDGATAYWTKKDPDSTSHINYLDIVLGRMARYDGRPDWEGDTVISAPGITYNTNMRYAIKDGDRWYPKAGGATSYEFRSDSTAIFLGQVAGTSWGAIRVMTARFSPDGKAKPVIGYISKVDAARITKV
jgi:hypothetical protein